MSNVEPVIFYHAGCMDGFAAACVVAQHLDGHGEYRAVQYGDACPVKDCAGREVYVVDFSWPLEDMKCIGQTASCLIWFDHHKTARPIWKSLGHHDAGRLLDSLSLFDESRSGAMIAWCQLFLNNPDRASTEPPRIIGYVQDRDLWRWALPESHEVNAGLRSLWGFDRSPTDYATFFWLDTTALASRGQLLMTEQKSRIRNAIGRALRTTLDGIPTLTVNAGPIDASEIGQAMCQGTYPDGTEATPVPAAVACCFWYDASANEGRGGWIHSLRSVTEDVAEIAKRHGGGGHKAAAGFVADHPIPVGGWR